MNEIYDHRSYKLMFANVDDFIAQLVERIAKVLGSNLVEVCFGFSVFGNCLNCFIPAMIIFFIY